MGGDLEFGRRATMSDGMTYPWLWVLWGKGFGRRTRAYVGTCSMGKRYQLRIDVRGYFIALVFRRNRSHREEPPISDAQALEDRLAVCNATDCTCGNGNGTEEHSLRCAKWIAALANHASRSAPEGS